MESHTVMRRSKTHARMLEVWRVEEEEVVLVGENERGERGRGKRNDSVLMLHCRHVHKCEHN